MSDQWWNDDDLLLRALGEAVRGGGAVPPEFVAAGRAAFSPPDLDAELAALIYDSEREPALTRTETATLRALTFAAPSLTIELELTPTGMTGQVVPPTSVAIEVHTASGETLTVTTDELGWFTVDRVPDGALRLRCRDRDRLDVVTTWITARHE
ncbi:hypothetical protein [Phytohabitans aurantiacus]|jgi:hypothetical protein|uniref:Carboxypeptidase regulatory-like domain-containing protein n=1 Tax=Phytohabitans aurantiacus TaxID=3016789 RepID=A0ABQ5R5Z6_9ACTN|nr:hypothetical protein [Phytohabitans aurantiacus]GLI02199.1 hypothetical protein Pa4123_74770 [Phytohabitans aurantiacus]